MKNNKEKINQEEMDPRSLFRKSNDLFLDARDREFLSSLRGKLVLHMERNPAIVSPSLFAALGGLLLVPALATLVLIIFILGGTTRAAELSLPGDALYPVKILSEEIIVTASFTSEDRTKAHLMIAGKRVEEASRLIRNAIDSGRNDKEFHDAIKEVTDNFDEQVSASLDEARKLREKDETKESLKISSDVKAATDSYQEVLSKLKDNSGFNSESGRNLDSSVKGNSPGKIEENGEPRDESGKHESENKNDGDDEAEPDKLPLISLPIVPDPIKIIPGSVPGTSASGKKIDSPEENKKKDSDEESAGNSNKDNDSETEKEINSSLKKNGNSEASKENSGKKEEGPKDKKNIKNKRKKAESMIN